MKKTALFLGLVSGLLFGMATPLSKFLLSGLNAFQLAGLLYLGAAMATLPWAMQSIGKIPRLFTHRPTRMKIVGIIFFGGLAGPVLLMLGLQAANAASVSIWLNMELVATALLGVFLFKEHVDWFGWIGIALALSAGVITSWGVGISGIGAGLLVVAACFCWGMDNNLTSVIDATSPQMTTFIKGAVAGSVNLMVGMLIGGGQAHLINILFALGVGAASYGISIVLYVISAQSLGATRSQILFSTATFWGVFLSFLLLGEPIGVANWIAMTLLVIGIIVTNIIVHAHSHHHEAMDHIHYHTHDDGHHDHDHHDDGAGGAGHTHRHSHEDVTHTHKHGPDIHHRHRHDS